MKIAGKIKGSQDYTEMLRRSLKTMTGLYSEKTHFIFELLQNADDAGASCIEFAQYEDRLEVLHDGSPFTVENLKSLCDIGLSDKKETNAIGEFGVGFKSVFTICSRVMLYSNPDNYRDAVTDAEPFAIRIDDFVNPEDIDEVKTEKSYTTRFVFPYAYGMDYGYGSEEELKKAVSEKLCGLDVTALLFMRHIREIKYRINLRETSTGGSYKLKTEKRRDCRIVRPCIERDRQEPDDSGLSYIVFSKRINSGRYERMADIAFAFTEEEGNLHFVPLQNERILVFFPTVKESKLHFIVQGPYRTTPDRGDVPDREENNEIARQTAGLLYDSVLKIREMGKLDLDFLMLLPLEKESFYKNGEPVHLFSPLFDMTEKLFREESILPCRDGGFTDASHARLGRSSVFDVFSDRDLTLFLENCEPLHWVSDKVTESSSLYMKLHNYLTGILKMNVIRPEDLRVNLENHPGFLESKLNDKDWLTRFYNALKDVPKLFSREEIDRSYGSSGRFSASERSRGNLLTVPFIKTQKDGFCAPFEDEKNLIEKVFIPSCENEFESGIKFADYDIYQSCKDFFEGTVRLKQADQFVKWAEDFKKRYEPCNVGREQHIRDIKRIIEYRVNPGGHKEELDRLLRLDLHLLCKNGDGYINPYREQVYFPIGTDDIRIEDYFYGIGDNCRFVDYDFYKENGVDYNDLKALNVRDSIVIEGKKEGTYPDGSWKKIVYWKNNGDFRWSWSIEKLKDALDFISRHPDDENSRLKSATVFKLLQQNEKYLEGSVYLKTYKRDEKKVSYAIEILNREYGGNASSRPGTEGPRCWVYNRDWQLVAPQTVSAYDLNTELYGAPRDNSVLYRLLGFREIDNCTEVSKRFGLLSAEERGMFLERCIGQMSDEDKENMIENISRSMSGRSSAGRHIYDEDEDFPEEPVKNWERLRRYEEQIYAVADPVRYEKVLQSKRTSINRDMIKSYLHDHYKVEKSGNGYACQLCHKPFANIEICQIDNRGEAEKELEPMHLCLCPNCHAVFNDFKKDTGALENLRMRLKDITPEEINGMSPVKIEAGKAGELWFVQIHIAEISELLKLMEASGKETEK